MSILIFAGTSEGRRLAAFLSARGIEATLSVATEYGDAVLPPLDGITVRQGRLEPAEMRALMAADTLVIDATHPYADAVTRNIRAACAQVGAEYIRLLRPSLEGAENVVTVPDADAAAAYLNTVTGAALLTTGSKELAAFAAVERFAARLYARVLPTSSVICACEALGFAGKNLIAMQGPFTEEMNVALLRQTHAKYLVTKDSGAAGGFAEKLSAARKVGAVTVLIARPTEEDGLTFGEVCTLLDKRFYCAKPAQNEAKFPLFVSLAGKKAVVFGAGKIAARRIEILRRFGAAVTVIAPESRSELAVDIAGEYEKSHLSGAFLVLAATDDRAVNQSIAADCRAARILCSVADAAEESSFFFPAVCRRGCLTAGVVSNGAHHAATAKAAQRIRRILEEEGV